MTLIELTEAEVTAFGGFPEARPRYWAGLANACPNGLDAYPGSALVEKNAIVYVPYELPYIRLTVIMDLLLGPFGCPWDREQTHESLVKYLIEEAYETIDAIESKDSKSLNEELGDLLLQPIFHAAIAERAGTFPADEPARGIGDKLLRRHQHVFGDGTVADSAEVLKNWDVIKKSETSSDTSEVKSILAGVPRSMPSLTRANEISIRAARAGFEWPTIDGVFEKLHEEILETQEAIKSGDSEHICDELGDLLFTVVNLARWQKIDPEQALRKMLDRFQSRFEAMERSSEKPLRQLTPAEWDQLWCSAKTEQG